MEREGCMDEVFANTRRVFNLDETALFLCPKGSKVIVKRGQKIVHSFTNNDDKECLTALLGGNAAGMETPPMKEFLLLLLIRCLLVGALEKPKAGG